MRTREEIHEEIGVAIGSSKSTDQAICHMVDIQLEILLDIRELLSDSDAKGSE